jgi:voltage-gated potassium channel Kch
MSRFLREPVSVRNAANVIVVATAMVVVVGGVLMRLLDHSEYPSVGRGLWWAMQTVTTVGYGDVTPEHTSGRIIASLIMLWGIAFLAILIAAITSTFVARAATEQREQVPQQGDEPGDDALRVQLEDISARLQRVEKMLTQRTAS